MKKREGAYHTAQCLVMCGCYLHIYYTYVYIDIYYTPTHLHIYYTYIYIDSSALSAFIFYFLQLPRSVYRAERAPLTRYKRQER